MLNKNKLNPVVTELFLKIRKLHIFITQSYFAIPKNIRIVSTQKFIMEIPNKSDL